MSVLPFVSGLPGVKSGLGQAVHKIVFKQYDHRAGYLAGGKIIDGTLSRDPFNSPDTGVLSPGLLMGKVTATNKYAPSILGVSQNAYTSGGTTITVTAAQAVEIARRVGASGTLKYVGPPSANGTNAVIGPIAYSAVNQGTGAITTTTLGVNLVAGGFVVPTDGSETPITFIPDGWGQLVVDGSGTGVDQEFPKVPVTGVILSYQINGWPADTSLRSWIETSLNAHGKYVFDYAY